MKLLSICDPTRYGSPPLDVPTFYQRLSADPRVEFYHLPTPNVFTQSLPEVQVIPSSGDLTYEAFLKHSCGGRGVFKIWYENQQFYVDHVLAGMRTFSKFAEVMTYLQGGMQQPLQFCRYLQHTDAGDKRVVVVDGEIYGSYLRRSKSGHWVNNVSLDGECTLAEITPEEVEAIENTVGHYQALGLHTLGYDFLLDDDGIWRISEINAGNIGGFARLELLTGQPVMNRLIDWLLDYAQRPRLELINPSLGVASC